MPSEADVVEMMTQVDASGEGSFDLPAFLELMTMQIGTGFSGESICEADVVEMITQVDAS